MQKIERDPTGADSPTFDDLAEQIQKYWPMLREVEILDKAAGTSGRWRTKNSVRWVLSPDKQSDSDDNDPELLVSEIHKHCESVEAERGLSSFRATFKLNTDNGTKEHRVPFSLHDTTPADEATNVLTTYQRLASQAATVMGRQFELIDSALSAATKQANITHQVRQTDLEIKRLEYEREDRIAAQESQERTHAEFMKTITALAPSILAVMAAKNAQKESDGPPKPAWKRLQEACATIYDRGGHDEKTEGILNAIVNSKSREEVSELAEALSDAVKEKHNPLQWAVQYPEIRPHLAIFAEMPNFSWEV